MTNEDKTIGLGPFTTLSTFARKAQIPNNLCDEFILIDSIGFIEDMHPIILKAFHATLGELATADLVLLFIDASDDSFPLERKVRSCSQILREMDVTSPTLICANKTDRMSNEQLEDALTVIHKYFLEEKIIPASVKTGTNLDMVLSEIGSWINDERVSAKPQNPPTPD